MVGEQPPGGEPGPSHEETVRRIFSGASDSLKAEFVQSAVMEHRGAKGRVREALVAQRFMSKYAPRNVAVACGGEILTTNGETSNECDLVLYEPRIPPLLEHDEYSVFPIESVYGVCEVKSQLTSEALEDAHKKIARIKRFKKDAYDDPSGRSERSVRLYGRVYHYFPIVGFVFAFESAGLHTLAEKLEALQGTHDPSERVDSVWVLDKGMLLNALPSGEIETSPMPGSAVAALESDDPLLWMAVMLQDTFQSAFAHPFRLVDYLKPSCPLGRVVNGGALNRRFRSNQPPGRAGVAVDGTSE